MKVNLGSKVNWMYFCIQKSSNLLTFPLRSMINHNSRLKDKNLFSPIWRVSESGWEFSWAQGWVWHFTTSFIEADTESHINETHPAAGRALGPTEHSILSRAPLSPLLGLPHPGWHLTSGVIQSTHLMLIWNPLKILQLFQQEWSTLLKIDRPELTESFKSNFWFDA